jgi:AcrR family transcriptional regulator
VTSTRSQILAEAMRQLPRDGYAAFTMASVRDAVGVSNGSLFHAFPSKPALAAAVYVEGMAGYQHEATAALTRAPTPARALRAWIATHLGWIEGHRALARYLFATLPDEVMAEAAHPLQAHNERFYAALTNLFEQATAAGIMGPLERPVAQALCIGPAHEYGRQWSRGYVSTPPRAMSRTFQDAALAALATTCRRQRKRPEARP